MAELEILVIGVSIFISVKFLLKWYSPILSAWPPHRARPAKVVLGLLPAVSLASILYVLISLASFDVTGDGFYLAFYLLLGLLWLYLGEMVMSACFDISFRDDILGTDNRAALAALTGGFLGMTCIFAAANIGDGPGWWCVIFAGGLGLAAWAVLVWILNALTGILCRVTVGRDIGAGIRLGCYLLSAGLIMGRASAGDWTSFSMTVVEFGAGWPALPLTLLAVLAERAYISAGKTDRGSDSRLYSSMFCGLVIVACAVIALLLLPLPAENPMYTGS